MEPLLLNIETSTDICSVGIAKGTSLLALKESSEAYSHSKEITLLIEACASAAGIRLQDLDAVAISAGPGSYTALRVGASVAKGICYALDKPMIAIDTLKALAYAAKQVEPEANVYIPMIDARRMEVYAAIFDQDLNRLEETNNVILDEQSFAEQFTAENMLAFSGNGAAKSQPLFEGKKVSYTNVLCSAQHLIPLSLRAFSTQSFVDIAYYAPVYFKAPNITISKKTL